MRSFHKLTACLLTSTYLFAAGSAMAAPERDAEITALKAQLKALSARLEALEKEKAPTTTAALATPAPTTILTPDASKKVVGEGQPVVGGNMPNSFKLPGTNTSVKLGGYAKFDAIADLNNAYGAQFASFAAIPLDGSAADRQDGKFNAHARQSRINLETHTPTELGELKTFFEVDFFGSARGNANTTNGEGIQLRQAYGQVGHVLAGQTWSNFMDMDAYPESLDYVGPAGLTFVRQAQVRYTDTITPHLGYAVALESPQTDFTTTSTKVNLSDMPDLTGKLTYKDTFGQVALRGLARKLDAGDSASGAEDEAFGWGVALSGKILSVGKDSLLFQGVYGDGVGRYLFDVAISGNGNTYINNDVEPQVAYGGYLGYQHYWSDAWRSNFLAGYTGIDNDTSRTGFAVNKEIASGHVNLIWSPFASYKVGMEFMHGYRELENGKDGSLNRAQASFMYLF